MKLSKDFCVAVMKGSVCIKLGCYSTEAVIRRCSIKKVFSCEFCKISKNNFFFYRLATTSDCSSVFLKISSFWSSKWWNTTQWILKSTDSADLKVLQEKNFDFSNFIVNKRIKIFKITKRWKISSEPFSKSEVAINSFVKKLLKYSKTFLSKRNVSVIRKKSESS